MTGPSQSASNCETNKIMYYDSGYYTDVGHIGDAQCWYLIGSDIKLGRMGDGEEISHEDHPAWCKKNLSCGRVDHSKKTISLCGYEDDEDLLYAKKLLAMDFPTYKFKLFY